MFIPKRRLFASFWDLSPLEGPPGHINPKTIWDKTLQQLAQSPLAPLLVLFLFCLPLSQSLVAHSSGLFGTSRPVFPLSVFLTCNVGMKNGIPCTFSSGRVTSGNSQAAIQSVLDIEYPMVHNSSEFPQTDCGFSGNICNDNANSTKFI